MYHNADFYRRLLHAILGERGATRKDLVGYYDVVVDVHLDADGLRSDAYYVDIHPPDR